MKPGNDSGIPQQSIGLTYKERIWPIARRAWPATSNGTSGPAFRFRWILFQAAVETPSVGRAHTAPLGDAHALALFAHPSTEWTFAVDVAVGARSNGLGQVHQLRVAARRTRQA